MILVEGDRTLTSSKVNYQIHDPGQLVVAVIAENPERIVNSVGLLPNRNQVAPLVIGMTPEDLPARVEAWGLVDRIIWQDVDSERLDTPQRSALQAWIAGGGRLVISRRHRRAAVAVGIPGHGPPLSARIDRRHPRFEPARDPRIIAGHGHDAPGAGRVD